MKKGIYKNLSFYHKFILLGQNILKNIDKLFIFFLQSKEAQNTESNLFYHSELSLIIKVD